MNLFFATKPNTPATAYPQAKELSWHAAFGWSTPTYCYAEARKLFGLAGGFLYIATEAKMQPLRDAFP